MVDVALVDVMMPNITRGISFLKKMRSINSEIEFIIFSRQQRSLPAKHDQNPTGFNSKHLLSLIHRILERKKATTIKQAKKNICRPNSFTANVAECSIIGESIAIRKCKEAAAMLKGHGANVMLQGETGTGKELFARLLHAQERDAGRPFVSVNCAAVPDNLLESILFGYEKGAFTGAEKQSIGKFTQANGGDIFLDEISCLSPTLQAKLLRVIEEKEVEPIGATRPKKVDFRVLSATNENIEAKIKTGHFRIDLYFRLNTVVLPIPNLNARGDDVVHIANYFLQTQHHGKYALSKEVKEYLLDYDWKGNVRELKNLIEKMVIFFTKTTDYSRKEWRHSAANKCRASKSTKTICIK